MDLLAPIEAALPAQKQLVAALEAMVIHADSSGFMLPGTIYERLEAERQIERNMELTRRQILAAPPL